MRNDIVENIKIDLSRNRTGQVVYVRRNDTKARTLVFSFTNNGKLVDISDAVTAMIHVKKPDARENLNTCIRDGNLLRYTIRTQDINVVGVVEAQIVVGFSDGSKFSSPVINIDVYDDVAEGSPTESENTYSALIDLVADAKRYADEAADSAAEVAKADETVERITNKATEAQNMLNDIDAAAKEVNKERLMAAGIYDGCEEFSKNCQTAYENVLEVKDNVKGMGASFNRLYEESQRALDDASALEEDTKKIAEQVEKAAESANKDYSNLDNRLERLEHEFDANDRYYWLYRNNLYGPFAICGACFVDFAAKEINFSFPVSMAGNVATGTVKAMFRVRQGRGNYIVGSPASPINITCEGTFDGHGNICIHYPASVLPSYAETGIAFFELTEATFKYQ